MSKSVHEILLREISLWLLPLATSIASDLKEGLLFSVTGRDFEAGFDPATDQRFFELISSYKRIDDLIDSPPEKLTDILDALDSLEQLFTAVSQIPTLPPTEPHGLEELAEALTKALAIGYLEGWHPAVHNLLALLTVIRPPADILLNRIPDLLRDPAEILRAEYLKPQGLVTPEDAKAVADKLFPRLAALCVELGVHAVYRLKSEIDLDLGEVGNHLGAGILTVFLQPDLEVENRYGVNIGFSPRDLGDLGLVVLPFGEISPFWDVYVDLTAVSTGFAIGPQGLTTFGATHPTEIRINASIFILAGSTVGGTTGTRLQFEQFGISCDLSAPIDPTTTKPVAELKITLAIENAKFVFDRGDGDGLLKRIFPEEGLEFSFDFKLNYSNRRGIYFEGQAGTELIIPVGLKLGSAFTLPEIQLGFKITDKHGLVFFASLTGQTKLGPLFLEIGRTGVQLELLPRETGKPAALGLADVEIGFKPPSQIGVTVDAKLIEGGGFLSFDPEAGIYFGVVYLTVKHKYEIKAIGIIQTRVPDGSEGFSFLLLITFELPGIQLGMGFRLEGVGGLVGINRTIDREALVVGLRDNTLDNILFPEDPVKNAALICRQSTAVFPAHEGSHTFGIVFLLSWGSKGLVHLKLGLVLKYQDPTIIALLGVLKIAVEKTVMEKKVEIVRIQVNFKADYEEGKSFAFDSTLYNSKFLGFELQGDLCIRWKGAPDPYFLLSAGGFHPDFQPPALGLPKDLQRLKFTLADSESVKISGYAYFAVTSNTLQFGGGFEAYIKVWKLSVEGKVSFDAIFYRTGNPNFKVNATGSVKVKIWGHTIGGIELKGELSGTTPWHFDGSVTFEIGWWDYTKSVDKTWGDEGEEIAETISLLFLLKEELSNARAWQPVRRRFAQGVSIRPVQTAPQERVMAHPDESLEVRQALLPLGVPIDHYGHFDPSDFRKFVLTLGTDSGFLPTDNTSDFFAPGEFFELSQDERMTRKSFDSYNAGLSAADLDKLLCGSFRQIRVEHERKVIDDQAGNIPPVPPLPLDHFRAQIRGNAVAKSRPGRRVGRTVRRNLALKNEEFDIVDTENLTRHGLAANEAEAHIELNKLLKQDPSKAGKLAVAPLWEIES